MNLEYPFQPVPSKNASETLAEWSDERGRAELINTWDFEDAVFQKAFDLNDGKPRQTYWLQLDGEFVILSFEYDESCGIESIQLYRERC
jgi:hypothetical protein